MTINNGIGKNIVIGILIAALLIMNVIVPFMKEQNANKRISQKKSLVAQSQTTTNQGEQKSLANQVVALRNKPLASSASADKQRASSTTTDCRFLYNAALSSWDLGAEDAGDAIFELYWNSGCFLSGWWNS